MKYFERLLLGSFGLALAALPAAAQVPGAQFAGSTGVTVNLKLASVFDTEDIDFSIHDSLQQFYLAWL